MKKVMGIFGVIALCLLVGSMASTNTVVAKEGKTYTSPCIANSNEIKVWTVMVFINADNNLYEDSLKNVNSMGVVGSTSEVNIVMIFDGSSPHKDDAKICYITRDDNPDVISSSPRYDHNAFKGYEANMGGLKTLADFTKWCMKEHPAQHYMLIIWDHGGGFLGYDGGSRSSMSGSFRLKGVRFDGTDEDYLTIPELRDALKQITHGGREKLDIVGFDACLMGMVEIFHELSPYAKYAVASEEVEWCPGWHYEGFLQDLTENPKISPKEFAAHIVDSYRVFYGDAMGTTMSAIDLAEVGSIVEATDDFAQCLGEILPSQGDELKKARDESQEYCHPENIDLYHFAELSCKYVANEKVGEAATKVMNTIEQAVIAEVHSMSHIGYELGEGENKQPVVNSHGIAIYFPKTPWSYRGYYNGKVRTLKFTMDCAWDEFLHSYYSYLQGELTNTQEGQ